jgi:hypothetical protein
MAEHRRNAASFDAELTRREDAENRMAASLLELDRHPGHQLLSGCAPTGTTGARWGAAQQSLAGLWRDFAAYRTTVHAARDVRRRRQRPGDRELAELHRLLVEPTIEVARTAVALTERGLTGAPERVETVDLQTLGDRMEQAFGEVIAVVTDVDAARTAFLATLVPALERLAESRRLAAGLGLGPADPETAELASLTDRAAALEREGATDPLALAAGPPADELAAIERESAAVAARLSDYAALRDRWDADRADIKRAVDALGRERAAAERTRDRVAELIAGPVPALPADELPEILRALAGLGSASGWAERTAGLAAVRRSLDDAGRRLRTAHELATGLLERRDELRGRFGAFRARATRLGRAERPAVLELDAQIERLLWNKPCDLAAATRALASYRQHLAGPVPGRSA